MSEHLRTTPLTPVHKELGARMAPFAGYDMPISYTGIVEEHMAVRENAGLFDVSHMGEFIISGKGAYELVQYVTSNDVSKLFPGRVQYSCFPNDNGGIVDDLLVYRLEDVDGLPSYMLVVNASNIEKDWNWINSKNSFGAQLVNISDQCGLLALQGPQASKILSDICKSSISELPYYHFLKGEVAGQSNIIVSATGYTGSGGFEIYADNDQITSTWEAIAESGNKTGMKYVGLGARDTLRLEMGYCLYGNDIDDNTSPLEAGLGWITKLGGEDFVSKSIFTDQKEKGLSRKLVGFEVNDRRVARHGYEIQDMEGNAIGVVTSGGVSPVLQKPIGLGYVPIGLHKTGTELSILAGRKTIKATVVKLPFYKIS